MFWDFVTFRFHLAFGVVADGPGRVDFALSEAYCPQRHLFALWAQPPAVRLPVVNELSRQLLVRNCLRLPDNRRVTQLGNDADRGAEKPPWDDAQLQAALTTAGYLDEMGVLTPVVTAWENARQTPAAENAQLAALAEAAAFDQMSGCYLRRNVDLFTRLFLVPPMQILRWLWGDFIRFWVIFWERGGNPAEFAQRWFSPLVGNLLERGPRRVYGVSERPVWIQDPSEWVFVVACHRCLNSAERLALFLLLHGELDVRQVFRLLNGRTSWAKVSPAETWEDGLQRFLNHLGGRWATVIRWMAEQHREAATGN